jgi:hypothetical protein
MMRSQSSIEFLTTYSFLFIILGVMISIILFLSMAPSLSMPSQCSAFSGPTCNFVAITSNSATGYSLVTISVTNSQSVPINITSMNTTIKSLVSPGACTPTFLYPGQEATCVSPVNSIYSLTNLVEGYYVLNAQYCNSGISSLSAANCTFEKVFYSGSFSSEPIAITPIVFSVAASQSPRTSNLIPYSMNLITEPNNYTILQNGAWIANSTIYAIGYAFANNAAMIGHTYFTFNTVQFPQIFSSLSNNNIACNYPPYNSMLSIASTTLYVNPAMTLNVMTETSGAIGVFYREVQTGSQWVSAFGASSWKPQGPTKYVKTPINLNKDFYNLEVVWSDPCGSGGQIFEIGGTTNMCSPLVHSCT